MQNRYDQSDFNRAQAQAKGLWIWLGALCLAAIGGLTASLVMRMEWLTMGLTILLGGALIFLWDLKLKPVRCYQRFLRDVTGGIQRQAKGVVVSLDKDVSFKDGLYFYRLIINVDEKRDEEGERQYFFDACKPRPHLVPGQWIDIVTHGNTICQMRHSDPPEGQAHE